MRYRFYPAERLEIVSIASKLAPEENAFRRWLMDYTIEHKRPFNLMNGTPQHPAKSNGNRLTGSLVEKRAAVVDADGNVNFIYPVSALPTNHVVRLADGRSFHAMCAIDALGTAFTFEQDVRIESKCSECGEALFASVEGGKIAALSHPGVHALHVDLNKVDNWATSC